MGQVTVTLNGRTYRLRCGDGEEARLLELSDHVRQKIERLSHEFGQVGDDRLLVMAALLIADELLDAQAQLAAAAQPAYVPMPLPPGPELEPPPAPVEELVAAPMPLPPVPEPEPVHSPTDPPLKRALRRPRSTLEDRLAEAREAAERKASGG